MLVDLRLTTNTKEEMERAIAHLKEVHGARITLRNPYAGNQGGWLARGALIVPDPPTRPPAAEEATGEPVLDASGIIVAPIRKKAAQGR